MQGKQQRFSLNIPSGVDAVLKALMIIYRECLNHEFRKHAELTCPGPVGLDSYLQCKQDKGKNIFLRCLSVFNTREF